VPCAAWGVTQYEENITDTSRVGSRLYYRFDHFGHKFENALLRMTEGQELIVRKDTTEQVWLKFAAEIGEQWPVRGSDGETEWTVTLQSKNDTIRVPAGTFFPCYRFYFRFNGEDNDWVEWYAPNVGPAKRDLLGFAFIEHPLLSATIYGKNLPTKVDEKGNTGAIRTFELGQNYPNPFSLSELGGTNRATVIRYSLAEAASVTLGIYDVLGREIKTLVQRHEQAGVHGAIWDGTNAFGEKVPAGIYFYRIRVGDWAQVRKLVLMQ
jgi:hypothetical protein